MEFCNTDGGVDSNFLGGAESSLLSADDPTPHRDYAAPIDPRNIDALTMIDVPIESQCMLLDYAFGLNLRATTNSCQVLYRTDMLFEIRFV